MLQELKFHLTLAFIQDADTGEFTASYIQFPEASAQGRTKQEAEMLLDQIFPYLLEDKKEEFMKYHKDEPQYVTFEERQMICTA